MRGLIVLRPDGTEVGVKCESLSYDGGSLICFKDKSMQQVVAAFSPIGWLEHVWGEIDEV